MQSSSHHRTQHPGSEKVLSIVSSSIAVSCSGGTYDTGPQCDRHPNCLLVGMGATPANRPVREPAVNEALDLKIIKPSGITIVVNCDAKKGINSINKALERLDPLGPSTLKVSGTCNENGSRQQSWWLHF